VQHVKLVVNLHCFFIANIKAMVIPKIEANMDQVKLSENNTSGCFLYPTKTILFSVFSGNNLLAYLCYLRCKGVWSGFTAMPVEGTNYCWSCYLFLLQLSYLIAFSNINKLFYLHWRILFGDDIKIISLS
jgi:hypothetical protein